MVEDHANSIWLTGKIFHLQYMTNSCMQMLAFVGLGLYCFMITRLKKGVVLMYGPGFSAPEGTVRISLANLNTEDCVEIARRLFELLDDYVAEYEQEAMKDAAYNILFLSAQG